jgi:hypothetical protein
MCNGGGTSNVKEGNLKPERNYGYNFPLQIKGRKRLRSQ